MKTFVALAALHFLASPAAGQQLTCAPLGEMQNALSVQYGEHPAGLGILENGHVLQRLESAGGKSWTMIVVAPDGMSCILLAGENWSRALTTRRGQEG